MKSEQEEIAELVRLLEAAETKVKELLPLHALVSTMVAATHGNVDGPGEEWKYPQVQEIVALFAQVASLEKEREERDREWTKALGFMNDVFTPQYAAEVLEESRLAVKEVHDREVADMRERAADIAQAYSFEAARHISTLLLPTEAGEREK